MLNRPILSKLDGTVNCTLQSHSGTRQSSPDNNTFVLFCNEKHRGLDLCLVAELVNLWLPPEYRFLRRWMLRSPDGQDTPLPGGKQVVVDLIHQVEKAYGLADLRPGWQKIVYTYIRLERMRVPTYADYVRHRSAQQQGGF